MKTSDYTAKEAAQEFNCTERLIRKLISAKAIKSYKIGNAVRIPASEIKRIKNTENN